MTCGLSHTACAIPDSKVHGANMGPIWGRQDPGGPHVDPINFAIWDIKFKTKQCIVFESSVTMTMTFIALFI